jgi:hypothetical protein
VDHQVNSRSEISLREPPIPSLLYQRSECKLARNSNSGEGGGYLMIEQARVRVKRGLNEWLRIVAEKHFVYDQIGFT